MSRSPIQINAGHRPGELILQAQEARNQGPVIVAPSDRAVRFGVEPLEEGVALVRYHHAPLPQASAVEPLLMFDSEAAAERALKGLEAALMAVDPPPSPPRGWMTRFILGGLATMAVLVVLAGWYVHEQRALLHAAMAPIADERPAGPPPVIEPAVTTMPAQADLKVQPAEGSTAAAAGR